MVTPMPEVETVREADSTLINSLKEKDASDSRHTRGDKDSNFSP